MSEQEYRTRIVEALAKIGWTLRHRGCNHWQFVDHKKEPQPFEFYLDHIQSNGRGATFSFSFYLKELKIVEIQTNGVITDGISFQGKYDEWLSIDCFNWDKDISVKNGD